MKKTLSLEKELKYELTPGEYRKLIKALRAKVVRRDKLDTYYLDDPALKLRKERFGLRVRITNGKKAHVTLKFPAKANGSIPKAYKVKHEFEAPVRIPLARSVIRGRLPVTRLVSKPIRHLRNKFSPAALEHIITLGKLTTYRTLARVNKLPLEIDRCEMFRKKFYELEVETDAPEQADAAVRRIFKEHGIRYFPSRESKLARFLKEWKKKR